MCGGGLKLHRKKKIIPGWLWSTWCLYGHAEWVETRNLTLGNFDSCLRFKLSRKLCDLDDHLPDALWLHGQSPRFTSQRSQVWILGGPCIFFSVNTLVIRCVIFFLMMGEAWVWLYAKYVYNYSELALQCNTITIIFVVFQTIFFQLSVWACTEKKRKKRKVKDWRHGKS